MAVSARGSRPQWLGRGWPERTVFLRCTDAVILWVGACRLFVFPSLSLQGRQWKSPQLQSVSLRSHTGTHENPELKAMSSLLQLSASRGSERLVTRRRTTEGIERFSFPFPRSFMRPTTTVANSSTATRELRCENAGLRSTVHHLKRRSEAKVF